MNTVQELIDSTLGKENHLQKCPARVYLYLYFGGYMVHVLLQDELPTNANCICRSWKPTTLCLSVNSFVKRCRFHRFHLSSWIASAGGRGTGGDIRGKGCKRLRRSDTSRPWQGSMAGNRGWRFPVRNLRISRGGRRFFGVLFVAPKKPGEKSQVLKLGRWDLT